MSATSGADHTADRPRGLGPPLLIANPRAGRKGDALGRVRRALRDRGVDVEEVVTAGPRDAERLARAAVEEGRRYLIAVGGDGTVHEIVNGMVDAASGEARAPDLVLGVVAGGSGCDFVRTFGLDRRPERLARHLDGDTVTPLDLGRVRYHDADGIERVRVFANIAEVGYGGLVVERAGRWPRFLGRSRYLLAVFGVVRRFETVPTAVTVDHTRVDEPMSNVVVANGQFFGGGMKVAPRALPDDGLFNVQCWRGTPRDVFLMTPRVRVGEHLGSDQVREYQSSSVRVAPARPLLVEADGEVLGRTPATFDVLPRVLRLKI